MSTTQKKEKAITIISTIPDALTIKQKSKDKWHVKQHHSGFHEHHQAFTWLKIDNPIKKRDLMIEIEWAEFDIMADRKFAYHKSGEIYNVIKGQIAPTTAKYTFTAPKGVSYFGSTPWYSIEDADRFFEKTCKNSKLCEKKSIGKTKEGRDIVCWVIRDKAYTNKKENLLIIAREHATETSGSFVIEKIVDYLLSKACPKELLEKYIFNIITIVNPDGVAHGRKNPQVGQAELSDISNWGRIAKDPTCKVVKDYITSLQPTCYISYHNYLSAVPEIIVYNKQDGLNILDYLVDDDMNKVYMWYLKRQVKENHTMLYYCYKKFGTVIGLFELPWAGRSIEEMTQMGLDTFLSVMEARKKR